MFQPPDFDYTWETSDVLRGQTIHGPIAYLRKSPEQAPKFVGLFFHGNACHMMSPGTVKLLIRLSEFFQMEMYGFDYCGYGLSGDGHATTSECTAICAQFMTNLALERARILQVPIILIGHSLGAAALLQAAAHFDVSEGVPALQIVLLSAFTTPVGVKFWMLRWVPLYYNNYKTLDECSKFQYPIHFVSGTDDQVISDKHTCELFERYQGPKSLELLGGETHGSVATAERLIPVLQMVLSERGILIKKKPAKANLLPAARLAAKQKISEEELLQTEKLLEEEVDLSIFMNLSLLVNQE